MQWTESLLVTLTLWILLTEGVIHLFREWHQLSTAKVMGLSRMFHTEDNDLDLVNEQSDSVYHGTSRHREGLLEPTTGAIVWMRNVFQGLSLFHQVVLLGGGRSPKWSDIIGGFR